MYAAKHAPVRKSPRQAFGARLKQLRVEQGHTQEEFADRVGLFRTYLSRLETGVANPTLDMIHALADALQVPVTTLFEPESHPAKKLVRAAPRASRGRVSKA